MKKLPLAFLAAGLTACQEHVQIAPEVALKHQLDAAFQRQVQLLQAQQVQVSTMPAGAGSPAVLRLVVRNPQHQPEQPDTLRQRVRKLAHLLVADLADPGRYQVVNAEVQVKRGTFTLGNSDNDSSQSFIYLASTLR